MNITKITFISVLALSSSACMFHRENLLNDAEYRLVGKTKDDLLACAGAPSSTRVKEGSEYLVYTNGRPSSEPDSCKLTFILNDGRVSKFDFTGDLTGLKAAADTCYQVIRSCW